jgi:hypothetical protein
MCYAYLQKNLLEYCFGIFYVYSSSAVRNIHLDSFNAPMIACLYPCNNTVGFTVQEYTRSNCFQLFYPIPCTGYSVCCCGLNGQL